MSVLIVDIEGAAERLSQHRQLYQEIAESHPSLLAGIVWCGRCGKSRKVDAAQCLRTGWPKCCEGTMGLDKPAGAKP